MNAQIKAAIAALYESRKARRSHPEGSFDKASRFYPSDREKCDGSGRAVRSPSVSWPYSYMLRCRTRVHCANLVAAAIAGLDVPDDVVRFAAGLIPQKLGVAA